MSDSFAFVISRKEAEIVSAEATRQQERNEGPGFEGFSKQGYTWGPRDIWGLHTLM